MKKAVIISIAAVLVFSFMFAGTAFAGKSPKVEICHMTDYFDVNFYVHMSIGQWNKPFNNNQA